MLNHQISCYQAGRNAINAYQSNFMGYQAGYSATGAVQISLGLLLVMKQNAVFKFHWSLRW
jgi:uncharacterized membrane protein